MRWGLWILGGLAGLIVLALVGLKLLQESIGNALFERTAARLVGADRTGQLDDGLHVFFCGTGSPLPDPARAGPCLAVLAGDTALVFDAGSGSMRKLSRMGFPMGDVDQVFLTHLHSDHIDGLGELMLQAWIAGSRTTPITISGPAGTAEVAAGFVQAYTIDSGYRTGHHGEAVASPGGFGARAEELEISTGGAEQVYTSNGAVVTAFLVDHSPVSPAFGYRVDYKGRSVTISGDTVKSAPLTEAARDTDLLVHEALNRDMVQIMSEAAAQNGNAALSQVFSDILDYHASPAEAAETAAEAGASALVLTHIVPPLPTRFLYPAFLGDAPSHFEGQLRVGEDGLLVSLPAGSNEIHYESLLN